jgi:hypothetical protein
MADSGATVNVVWDTELTANFRAQSHALQGFQGMALLAIGEAFLDVLVLRMFRMKDGLLSQQAASLWQGGVTSSYLSSRMIAAATMSLRSRLHLFGLPVSSRTSLCSGALFQMGPSSTLPLLTLVVRSFHLLYSLRPPPRCQQRAASVASLTSRWALRLMLTRARMVQNLPSTHLDVSGPWFVPSSRGNRY